MCSCAFQKKKKNGPPQCAEPVTLTASCGKKRKEIGITTNAIAKKKKKNLFITLGYTLTLKGFNILIEILLSSIQKGQINFLGAIISIGVGNIFVFWQIVNLSIKNLPENL